MTDDLRKGRMRNAFETWIKRGWHKSFRAGLVRNKYGVYNDFDLQNAWIAFAAGWRRARR